ncbi:MAG TPA: hypothetical protein VFQ39_08580, partial [Longimicrobium sp.]|nr:hypothetical protein [Longimicrobium sp.]
MEPPAPSATLPDATDAHPPSAEAARFRWVMPLLGALLFTGGAWVLLRELRGVRYGEVRKALRALPTAAVWASVALTLANYAVLTLFDLLAFRYIGRAQRWWKVVAA